MGEWNQVTKRARDEAAFAKETADKGAKEIERFYPELHPPSPEFSFTNTLGSYLIPDLLTSQTVVVDLYDWSTPEKLIEVYGVDLPFLISLRDANLIKICANLPIERYERHSWLHPLLADSRTIFRSIRTPAFVAAIDPDFDRRRAARQALLESHFTSLPSAEIQRLCGAVKAAYPPSDPPSLAAVLAQWLERLASFDQEVAAVVIDGFEREVVDRMPELMRLQRLIVSPHTAALGGMMKVERSKWTTLFGEEGLDSAIMEGHVRFQKLNAYFSEVELNLDSADLTSAQLWKNIRQSERNTILDHLSDSERKADLLAIENDIRIGLLAGGDRDPSRESIKVYVEKLKEEVTGLRRLSATLAIAAPVAFGFVSKRLDASIISGLSIAGGFFANKYLLGDRIRRATEQTIRKLRVVRVLSK